MNVRELLKTAVWDGMDSRCSDPCWADTNSDTIRGCGCMDKAADAIIAALDAAGLVVVPREPTEEMVKAAEEGDLVNYPAEDSWKYMIAASPFAKKEVG